MQMQKESHLLNKLMYDEMISNLRSSFQILKYIDDEMIWGVGKKTIHVKFTNVLS